MSRDRRLRMRKNRLWSPRSIRTITKVHCLAHSIFWLINDSSMTFRYSKQDAAKGLQEEVGTDYNNDEDYTYDDFQLPGIDDFNHNHRLVGGRVSKPRVWLALMVIMQAKKKKTNQYNCGGTLINSRNGPLHFHWIYMICNLVDISWQQPTASALRLTIVRLEGWTCGR